VYSHHLRNKQHLFIYLLNCRIVQSLSPSSKDIYSSFFLTDGQRSVIRLELKGADNSLRVRQIRVLGENGESLSVGRLPSTSVIQQKICESETLKVFRLITSQV